MITNEKLQSIKEEILHWANNCGGCETCSQIFGDGELTYDKETVFELIVKIEEQEKKIKELTEVNKITRTITRKKK